MAYKLASASSQYLEIESAVVKAAPLSFFGWFYVPTGSQAANGNMIWLGDKDVGNEYWNMQVDADGTVFMNARTSAGSQIARTTATWSNDTWHSAGGVAPSAASRSVLLDGANKVTNSTSRAPANADRTSIGRLGDSSPGTYFDSRFGELAIWNAALTDAEFVILHARYSPLFIRPGNLVAYYPFGGAFGRNSYDHNPGRFGRYNLTAFNAPAWANDHPHIIYPRAHKALILPVPPVATTIPPIMNSYRQRRVA